MATTFTRYSQAVKPSTCTGCALQRVGDGWVEADGAGTAGILIVGEAPGAQEASQGRPFVGAAGFALDRLLKRAGIDRTALRITNVIQCRPPKNELFGMPYEYGAIQHCSPNLDAVIAQMRPKVIVALGNIALRRLCGVSGITRYRGWPLMAKDWPIWVMPTLHPAYLLPRHGQKDTARFSGAVMLDLLRAQEIAQHGFRRDEGIQILEDPSPARFADYVDSYRAAQRLDPGVWLAWDLETPGKLSTPDEEEIEGNVDPTILRISFSFEPNRGVSVPWQGPWMDGIEALLGTESPQIVWNGWGFDLPRTMIHGFRPKGPVYDAMWLWHLLQSDLPRGLEKVASFYCPEVGPWKHTAASRPAWYSGMDSVVTLRTARGIVADLERRHLWEVAEAHVVRLEKLLFEAGTQRGVCIDRDAQDILATQLRAAEAALLRKAQTLVPDALKAVKLTVRAEPGSVPVETEAQVWVCEHCKAERVTQRHVAKCPGPLSLATRTVTRYQRQPDFNALEGDALRKAVILAGFNPMSTKALEAYVRFHRHKLGTNAKTGDDTVDKLALQKLVKLHGATHPIYALTLELREIRKTLGTYVEGFAPDRLGRIYPTYTQAPSTLRLSSRNPNIQNVTHRSGNPWADPIRRTIVPPKGHWFVESDWTAIEAVLTGYFMGDPEYIEAARRGIHAMVVCKQLGWDFTPENVQRVKAEHPGIYERTKRVIHATNYGMSPRLLPQIYPESFPTLKVAELTQRQYFEAAPRLETWHHEIRMLAHRQSWLENPWGYRHYFYDVYAKKSATGKIELGADAKRVVAFLPQSSAAAIMKDALLELGDDPRWAETLWGNCSVHDSICLTVPEADVEAAAAHLRAVMTAPIGRLGGLQINCAVKAGPTWADLKELP